MRTALALATFAVNALAQTPEEKAAYPEYAEGFAKWGYTWEPIKVHTDDGYTLTMFHFTGHVDIGPFDRHPVEVTKNAVIMQHGMGGSGANWLIGIRDMITPAQRATKPMAVQLVELGFDVYLTNNSGVQYSQVHDTLTVDDNEFWMMDWSKYGTIDFPAAVTEI